MDQVIGTCSICGGPVTVPSTWMAVIPPVPRCGRCGAVAVSFGPLIPMLPPRRPIMTTTAPVAIAFHFPTTEVPSCP